MLIPSRRISWLVVAFAFMLLIAPPFFASRAIAQENGVNIPGILPAATQGGIGIIMLVVYLVQSNKDKKKSDETFTLLTTHLQTSTETTKLAFEKYNERTAELIGLLKTSHEQSLQIQKDNQETTSLLTGTLSRLEVKLAVPVMCPLKEFSQIATKGVQGS